jgi:hypothetical protein
MPYMFLDSLRAVSGCPSSGVFHYTHSNGIYHTGLLTACEQDQDGTKFYPDPEKLLMMERGTVRNM